MLHRIAFCLAVSFVSLGPQRASEVVFSRSASDPGTRYTGIANSRTQEGAVNIYRGNVSLRFPEAQITIYADEARHDQDTKEFTVSGKVRVQYDRAR
jgi:lipopolysaccharide assembly outer membrane protein LptD (OstA)